ncbi:NADH dehydrogenase [ubiquinone] 1 subunit C1, mitochondrial isoform X1 [Simochromis diagramma]|uniref:NADH dehydrogenase [ubiquinone] 1 subunit C1, mitochondrial isoform X1 n=2 Tax=Simochromis diagramma TaxID=43689 RepID=UPI001A7EF859|nr:NADH dehydrogenase [ubiquinone] 1 subunit C1, mitochondrial isoform X1 [Simochromis diagramma]
MNNNVLAEVEIPGCFDLLRHLSFSRVDAKAPFRAKWPTRFSSGSACSVSLLTVKGQDAPEWSFDLSVILVSGLTGSLINRGANVQVERKVLSSAKMTFNRLLSRAVFVSRAGCRSAYTSSKPDMTNPNWFRVGLAFGTSAFLWGLLFKQHSTDTHEYKVRNGLE